MNSIYICVDIWLWLIRTIPAQMQYPLPKCVLFDKKCLWKLIKNNTRLFFESFWISLTLSWMFPTCKSFLHCSHLVLLLFLHIYRHIHSKLGRASSIIIEESYTYTIIMYVFCIVQRIQSKLLAIQVACLVEIFTLNCIFFENCSSACKRRFDIPWYFCVDSVL